MYAHFQIDDFLVNGDTEEKSPINLSTQTESRRVVTRSGGWHVTVQWVEISIWDEQVLQMDSDDSCAC